MRLRIDETAPVPPFEQLRAQLRLMVAAGRLGPGQRLPSIRSLATQLGLANGTVARAYRELEYAGIVEGRGRAGTFVVEEPPVAHSVIERQLSEAAAAFVDVADQLDIDRLAGLAAVEAAFDAPRRNPR